jgi:hypothetical protein
MKFGASRAGKEARREDERVTADGEVAVAAVRPRGCVARPTGAGTVQCVACGDQCVLCCVAARLWQGHVSGGLFCEHWGTNRK